MSESPKEKGNIWLSLKPFKNVIWFLFLFISFDFLWKLCVDEGEKGELFIFLGKDLTQYTRPVSLFVAENVYWIIHNVLGYKDFLIKDSLLYFTNETSMKFSVIWECTGIRQVVMFAFLIGLYFGPWKKKLWFIPLTLLILHVINLLRIVAVILIAKDDFPTWFISFNEWYNGVRWDDSLETYYEFYEDWFQFFHADIFRWLYYNGVIFLLWLWWEEKFNLPYQKIKRQKKRAV